jgi:hypothetical protein
MSEIISTNYKDYTNIHNQPWHQWDRESGPNIELAACVIDTVQDVENRQRSIIDNNRRHARIYCGYTPVGLAVGSGPGTNVRTPFAVTRNIARGVCETATALIVKTKPKSSFVTSGADFDIQTQAEDMDQFMLGAYERAGLYQVAPRSFLDSTIFGTGGWKYVTTGSGESFRVECERVLINDILIDEDECRIGLEPDCIYHRVVVRTDALIRKYANGKSNRDEDFRRKIYASQENNNWPTMSVPPGRCVLVDATFIDPFGISPNRRVVCTNGVVLKDEVWPFDFHPYDFLWWSLPISGFYGDGVCYRQYGRQERINFMYRWIQRVQDIYGTPRAWVDPAGGPPTLQLSNEIGAVITARKPPSFQVQNPVPSDVYRWLDTLERGGFEDEGISHDTGQGALPPGVDSAPAQREWNFRETRKFAPVSERWEHTLATSAAKKMIAIYSHHVKTTESKIKMNWASKNKMYSVHFPDLDKDAYIIRAEASSLDSLSPAARVQSALELAQTGWIAPQEGRALLSHPDLKEADDLDNSGETYAKWALRKLRRGEEMVIDEKVDLMALDRIIRQGRALAITQEAPSSIIDNMTRFLEQLDIVKQAIEAAQAPPAQPQMPAPGMAAGPGIHLPMTQ